MKMFVLCINSFTETRAKKINIMLYTYLEIQQLQSRGTDILNFTYLLIVIFKLCPVTETSEHLTYFSAVKYLKGL